MVASPPRSTEAMLGWMVLILLVAHRIHACTFNRSSDLIRPIISSEKFEYRVQENILITVRGDREPLNDEERNLTIKLSIWTRLPVKNLITCLNCENQKLVEQNEYTVYVNQPGEILITPKLLSTENGSSKEYGSAGAKSFLKIRVIKSTAISWASLVFGWTSFGLLIFSFYPQILWCFLHGDTSGVCQDFLALSFCGYVASAIFYMAFFFSGVLRAEFYCYYPLQQYPAHLSDIIFSGHQILAVAVLISQSLLYQTNQPLSNCGWTTLVCNLSPILVLMVFVVLNKFSLTDFVYFYMNFVRLVTLSVKYLPQITYNINRCTAYGFSQVYLFCDLLGNLFSIIQIVLITINLNDRDFLYEDYKNLSTVGMSFFSMLFGLVLLVQSFRLQANYLTE